MLTEEEMDRMTDEELLVAAEKEMKQAKLYALAAIVFCFAAAFLSYAHNL